jgi:hypothetical protein
LRNLCTFCAMLANAFWTDVHVATVVVLLLAGVALAATTAYVLGPAGRPAARRRRTGGLSRALATRAERYGEP